MNLAIYLLTKDKKTDSHLNEIIKYLDEKKDEKIDILDTKVKDVNSLRNEFHEVKCLGRIIKIAIELNEPEIAIMAGEELVEQMKESEEVNIMDYKNLTECLMFTLESNRIDLLKD